MVAIDVLTNRYNARRTGANLQETVINQANVYLTAKSKEIRLGKSHYFDHLHALDIGTGAARPHSPATIAETIVNDPENKAGASNFTFVSRPAVKGHGPGSVDGTITFNAFFQLQRPGLLLQNDTIFLAFSSQGDKGTYREWVPMACDNAVRFDDF